MPPLSVGGNRYAHREAAQLNENIGELACMYKRILAALDISESAVFETALSLASASDAALLLLHVLSSRDSESPMTPVATAWDHASPLSQQAWETYQQQWQDYADKGLTVLRDYRERATAARVRADFQQTATLPEHGICQTAKNWRADLIVMGSHRRRGLQELLLGSVSNYVMHHAPCSVMIVSLAPGQPEHSTEPTFTTAQSAAVS